MPSPLLRGGVVPEVASPQRHRIVQAWTRQYGLVFGYRFLWNHVRSPCRGWQCQMWKLVESLSILLVLRLARQPCQPWTQHGALLYGLRLGNRERRQTAAHAGHFASAAHALCAGIPSPHLLARQLWSHNFQKVWAKTCV